MSCIFQRNRADYWPIPSASGCELDIDFAYLYRYTSAVQMASEILNEV